MILAQLIEEFSQESQHSSYECAPSCCSDYCRLIVLFLTGFITYLQNNKVVCEGADRDLFKSRIRAWCWCGSQEFTVVKKLQGMAVWLCSPSGQCQSEL